MVLHDEKWADKQCNRCVHFLILSESLVRNHPSPPSHHHFTASHYPLTAPSPFSHRPLTTPSPSSPHFAYHGSFAVWLNYTFEPPRIEDDATSGEGGATHMDAGALKKLLAQRHLSQVCGWLGGWVG